MGPPNVPLRGAEPFSTRAHGDWPLVRGDAVRVGFPDHPVTFVVTETTPKGPVVVTPETRFSIRSEPVTEADFETPVEGPAVTCEDVGGHVTAEGEGSRPG